MNVTKRDFTKGLIVAAGLAALPAALQAAELTAKEARAIAKEACVYGFRLLRAIGAAPRQWPM
jgi:hypothetical protein